MEAFPIVQELAKWDTREWIDNWSYWQFMTFDGLARFLVFLIQSGKFY